MGIRITLAAALAGLATSCNLQLTSPPPARGEGSPPELVRITGMCLGGGTTVTCEGSKGVGSVVRFEHTTLQNIDWVVWDPVGRACLFDIEQRGRRFNTPLYPLAPTIPEGENTLEIYARPVGQTGPWVLYRRPFRQSVDPQTGLPVFDFSGETTRQWAAEADLPFKLVTESDGGQICMAKEVSVPIYPPRSYCLAPGAGWPTNEKPQEDIRTPALYTFFQPNAARPQVVIYQNGRRVNSFQSSMNYFPTAIPPGTEARYVIYGLERDPIYPGAQRWWRIWTPEGPLRLDLVDGRSQCQHYRSGPGWEKVAEGVYRSGEWQAEMMPEGFVFPGYNPDPAQKQVPPDQLPPELDPWR